MMKIKTDKKSYLQYNGLECLLIKTDRDDGLVEVYIPAKDVFILLYPHELED